MAIIKGQMFGDVSGKLGGTVFTRGKSGKMLRARVQPTDAKSAAQVSTRSTFSNVASMWNSLTTQVKRQWNSFASTIFRSKTQKKRSKPSGYQAFASSNFALSLLSSHANALNFTPTSINATFEEFAPNVFVPPTNKFSSLGTNTDGDSVPFLIAESTLNLTENKVTIPVYFPNGAPGAGFNFKNPNSDETFGLGVYLSKSQQDSYVGQVGKGVYFIAGCFPFDSVTGMTAITDFTFEFDVTPSYLETIKNSFTVGSICFLSLYAISKSGQFAKIGTAKCTIS